jgi:hypothetical protein
MALLASSAAAQPGSPSRAQDERERTELYKQAVELANAGRWADAVPKLQAVLALRSSPKVRYTLGQAQEHIGQLAAAYDTYGRVAAATDAAPPAPHPAPERVTPESPPSGLDGMRIAALAAGTPRESRCRRPC